MAANVMARQSEATSAIASDEGQMVVFGLGDQEFGVDINNVKEIVRLPGITAMPRTPDYIAGICNLRGNVLPVIDTRVRFSMETRQATDDTRLLVIETGGVSTGLVVDRMKEVMRISRGAVEPPPEVCKGVDKEFLSGVVKMDEGKRLILTLELQEVIQMEGKAHEETTGSGLKAEDGAAGREEDEEVQLVTYQVGKEEYAFHIEKVREILRVERITPVPNVPAYVKGLFTIRNHLMPILDLRSLIGLESILSEHHAFIKHMMEELEKWAAKLKASLETGDAFGEATDIKDSSFEKWLGGYDTTSAQIQAAIKDLKKQEALLFSDARKALDLAKSSSEEAVRFLKESIEPLLGRVLGMFDGLNDTMQRNITEDQRVLVVETNGMVVGYMVDSVNEVLRISKSIIDETPGIATSKKKELRGVAKLDKGSRLIMIMDESTLVSHEESKMLKDMASAEDRGKAERNGEHVSLAQKSMDEEQLITFTINKEEYGIRIMQVQEINRLSDITALPRAPYFIDGVTNLRGNVIPVLNIRRFFELETKDVDERTRIIIVELAGKKTGLRVDEVKEVLRLPKSDIEKTPAIVTSGGANRYMDGLCKVDDGKRMVVLLNVERLLDKEDLEALGAMGEEAGGTQKAEVRG